VLGPVRAWDGDRELNLGPRQQRQVLGLLLIRAGREVPVHQFVEMLWGHSAPASAVNSLHRFIGSLRRILEPGLSPREEGRWLRRRDAAYRIVVPESSTDLAMFRRLADEAREAEGLGFRDVAIARYVEALRQSRGRCADDGSGGPRFAAFRSIDTEYATVARDAARAAVAFDRIDPLLPAVRRAAESNPLDEALQARLMLMLAAGGRQADAFSLFQSVRDALARELGVDPGLELRAAYDEVLQPRPVVADGPAPMVRINPAQLPRDLPLFCGRRAELERAGRLLTRGDDQGMPIVAIDGMPGVGKSTFAVHWAYDVANRFPDGQIYLDLRGDDPDGPPLSPDEALCSLLSGLGVPNAGIPPGLGAKAALYRSHVAGRRLIVLLDNAEGVEQVRPLLPGSADCLVVITSRARLAALTATHGADLLTLEPPGADEARALLTRRLEATAGELNRAALRDALDTVVAACGRLPAALTAVTTEAASFPVPDLRETAAELRRRGEALDALGTEAADHLRTLFGRSYRRLGPAAARLFRLLPLHPGADLTTAAAASLTDSTLPEVRAALLELLRAHLISAPDGERFSSHVLLAAYARELSDEIDGADDQRAARARLLAHYRHTACAAHRLVQPYLSPVPSDAVPEGVTVEPVVDSSGALAWFRAEQRTLRTLIERHAEFDAGPAVWPLAITMVPFFRRGGLALEWLGTMRAALESAEHLGDRTGQAHLRRCLAGAHYFLGDHGYARDQLRRSRELFAELGQTVEQAYVHNNLGVVLAATRANAEAEAEFATAERLFRQVDHQRGVAAAIQGVAACRAAAGRYDSARDRYEQAIAIYLSVDDRNGVSGCLLDLGTMWHEAGDSAVAVDYLRRSVALYRQDGNRADEASALLALGDALAATETGTGASAAWRSAQDILADLRLPTVRQARDRLHAL